MEMKINIGGMDTVITVKDAAELVEAIKALESLNQQKQSGPVLVQPPVSAPAPAHGRLIDVTEGDEESATSQAAPVADAAQIKEALMYMKGNASATFLLALRALPEGGTDDQIRETLPEDMRGTQAPIMSHIAKCCAKAGITREAILVTKSKRGRRGKMRYHYTLTPMASEIIGKIENFDREPADLFPE